MDQVASPWAGYQSRYVAYCKIHAAATPDAMLARDEDKYPGGCMTGYIVWINQKWHEWDELMKRKGPYTAEDHIEFDRWLDHQAALAAAPEPEGGRT